MPESRQFHAEYAEKFQCLGSSCEDSCCGHWTVPVDEAAYARCQTLPAGPVRTLIDTSFVPVEQVGAASPAGGEKFAQIRMNAEQRCPLQGADLLCRIHGEYGAEYLPHACQVYPRAEAPVRGVGATALALSCPEAARLVLLTPHLLRAGRHRAAPSHWDEGLERFFAVQDFALRLVGNRSYPLWQRLLMLGLFSHRLDAGGGGAKDAGRLVAEFEAGLRSGRLRGALAGVEMDQPRQLDAVLRLAGMMLHRSQMLPRFRRVVEAFGAGIGNGPGATLEGLTRGYAAAHERYFAPFMERHPQILENYLANLMIRSRFPFGKSWAEGGEGSGMAVEFVGVVAQFVLMRGLLIGVSGSRREGFSAADVVETVQASAKHFEHHPAFAGEARALLVESRLDGAEGMGILLRNGAMSGERVEVPLVAGLRDVRELGAGRTLAEG